MKNIVKRGIAALLAAISMPAFAVTVTAEEERLPSGTKYEDIERKIENALNVSMSAGMDYYAGFETIVFCGDEIIHEGYYGCTDFENNIRCNEESVFEWGSISKTFIWVSAMQLWEQGKLDLDADIRTYLPDGFLQHLRYEAPITMMNIMDHMGGWCEGTYAISTPNHDELTTLAQALQETEPAQVNPPNTVTSYSNWGSALGAYVIECISGMDYVDYVHKNIFEPLGMTHTSIAADFSDNEWVRTQRDKLKSYSYHLTGYKSNGKQISYIKLYPAGSAAGTIRDLATYAQAFVNDDAPLFKHPETQEKLFSGSQFYGNSDIPFSSYGFAVEQYKVPVYGHDGGTIACTANMLFDRASKTGLVTFTNETTSNLILEGIPNMVFGASTMEETIDQAAPRKKIDGYFLPSRTQRAGILKFVSYLNPVNANAYPDLICVDEGCYLIEGANALIGDSNRTSGVESYIFGSIEIDKVNAYPAKICLLALYFMIAAAALFLLLFKIKAARHGRYPASAVNILLTVGQIVKLVSVTATIVMLAYVGRVATYGLPKTVGVTAGCFNIACIVLCIAAIGAAVIGIASKHTGKWMKAGYGVTIAANSIMILAIAYFEMFKFWAC